MGLSRLGVFALCCAGALGSFSVAAQQRAGGPPQITPTPPPLVTTGLIVGRVVDATTGKPVAGALVALNGGPGRGAPPPGVAAGVRAGGPPPQLPRILTDSDGRFAFRNLTRGTYFLTATKAGYAQGAYGRSRPDGAPRSLLLDDNERMNDVAIRIFKYAAITGRITDETGEPIVGAQVRAYRRGLVSGQRRFGESGSANTDDRGVYRIYNLDARHVRHRGADGVDLGARRAMVW